MPILGPFYPLWGIFLKNRALSVFRFYNHLPSCKKSEKINDQLPRKTSNWQMNKQTTDRQRQRHAPSVYGTGKFQFEVPCKKVIFKNFLKSTGKCICWSLIFNEIANLEVCKFIKKRLLQSCFPVNFAKFFRAPLL